MQLGKKESKTKQKKKLWKIVSSSMNYEETKQNKKDKACFNIQFVKFLKSLFTLYDALSREVAMRTINT